MKLSYSKLKAFSKSPNHLLQYLNRQQETTPAMLKGSALHCMVLEPEEYRRRYGTAPQVDRRTKEGKAIYNTFLEDNQGKEILPYNDYEEVLKMAEAVYNNTLAMELLNSTEKELELEKEYRGVTLRGFVDFKGIGFIGDLKTTSDASPKAFTRDSYNLLYHLQAAVYCELTGYNDFYIVAVENKAPYNVQVYMLDLEAISEGRKLLNSLIDNFLIWDGQPQGYSTKVEILELPKWA